jgi:hypothetical protein
MLVKKEKCNFIERARNQLHGGEHFLRNNQPLRYEEFPNILWNTKVCYLVHKNPPLVPIESQIDPVQNQHILSLHD